MAAKSKLIMGAVDALGNKIGALGDYLKEFDPKIYYHGTKETDIKEFEPRSFFTDDPEDANLYSTGEGFALDPDYNQATVYPVKIKTDEIYDMDNPEHVKMVNEFSEKIGMTGISDDIETSMFSLDGAYRETPDDVQEILETLGFKGVKESFKSDTGELINNIVIFSPDGMVRSVFAKFDPSKRKSGNILASVPAAGALGALGAMDGESSN
jgi:hypothetical protein